MARCDMLIHGDCLDVLPTLPAASVDMIFADLPYGVTRKHWDCCIPLKSFWDAIERSMKPHAAVLLTATMPFAVDVIYSRRELFRYDLVWEKAKATGFVHANRMPLRCHELVLVFSKQKTIYHPQKTAGLPYNKGVCGGARSTLEKGMCGAPNANITGARHPRSVLRSIPQVNEYKRLHPTEKPVALLEWLVRTYSNEGDIVLDPTAGSGTTAIAAMNTGRKWVCIEKDAGYHALAAKRIAEHQAGPAQRTLLL